MPVNFKNVSLTQKSDGYGKVEYSWSGCALLKKSAL